MSASVTSFVVVESDGECIRVTTNDADATVLAGDVVVAERDWWVCPVVTNGVLAWK